MVKVHDSHTCQCDDKARCVMQKKKSTRDLFLSNKQIKNSNIKIKGVNVSWFHLRTKLLLYS